jgi:nucleotide-binding universal stress UspA family protein
MFQRILLAWDGSEVAMRAFDVAIDLTRHYQASLRAVSIAYSPAHAETTADRIESSDAAHRYLLETFAQARDRAERAGVEVEHEIIEGDPPARTLLAHARAHGFDLIVCGHHHSHRAGRLLLHGVAEALVSDATTPVLVVADDS